MMKRQLLWLIAVILMVSPLLTSCSEESIDNPVQQPTEAQLKTEWAKKLVGNHIDISGILMDDEAIFLWNLQENGSFTVLELEMNGDVLDIDTIGGRWEPFVNAVNPLEPQSGEYLSGFKAIFDADDDVSEAYRTSDFYVEEYTDEDGQSQLLFFSKISMDYMLMMDNDVSATRGLWGKLWDVVKENIGTVATKVKNLAINIIGIDWGNNMKEEACKKFYEEASQVLSQMKEEYGANTNYAEWMNEIYTQKGKNPRICEMNILGSHLSMTGQILAKVNASYTVAQLNNIHEQWESGIRCFDIHFQDTFGSIETLDTDASLLVNHVLGMFDGSTYLDCTAEEGFGLIFKELSDHPGETAIAFLSIDKENPTDECKMVYDLMNKFKEEGKIVMNPAPGMTLNDCAGKLIILQTWTTSSNYRVGPMIHGSLDLSFGSLFFVPNIFGRNYSSEAGYIYFWDKEKKESDSPRAPFFYQFYSNASITELVSTFWQDKQKEMQKYFDAAQRTKGNASNTWVLNTVNAAVGGAVHASYAKNANVMNPWTFDYFTKHKGDKAGIIWMDFAGTNDFFDSYYTNGKALPHIIVETNRYQ